MSNCVMQVDSNASLAAPPLPANHHHLAPWHRLRWNQIAYVVALTARSTLSDREDAATIFALDEGLDTR